MTNITTEEKAALAVLTGHVNQVNSELVASMNARKAYIALLESKYTAEFDERSGNFNPKKKEKEGKQ